MKFEFRGMRVHKNEWVYGDLLRLEGKIYIISGDTSECLDLMNNSHEVIPETIGQFTGLKDKNNKKIFDGDIVKSGALVNKVEFIKGAFVLLDIKNEGCFDGLNDENEQWEIIGNIHDSKLLKRLKK